MKFKLDENIGRRGRDLLVAAGHDVATVREQGLGGCSDDRLFTICVQEKRILVTLDRDFGEIRRFPPEHAAGVIVLEAGPRITEASILDRMRNFLAVMETHSVAGSLWIVEAGRVRIHLDDESGQPPAD